MNDPITFYAFMVAGCGGVLLQIAVIYFMSRSALPRYWAVFLYLLVLFLTSVCDMAAFMHPDGYPDWYTEYWNINNFIRHLSGFAAVISLIFMATANHPAKAKLRAASLLGTAIAVGISLLLPEASANGVANRVGRDLSFATILLNVILWSSLIKTRHQDLRLFFVSGGLGVNMTGEAIGQSLAILGGSGMFTSLLAVGTHLFCQAIWLRAFRMPAGVEQGRPHLGANVDSGPNSESDLTPRDAES